MCFIALEGPRGSCKSQQAALLVGRLRGQGHDVMHLAFPSESPAGKATRHAITFWYDAPAAAVCCLAADFYSYAPAIRAHLSRGGFVVVDRWIPSGLVYGELDGLDPDWLRSLQHDLPVPDLNILLRVSFDTLCEKTKHLAGRYTDGTTIRILHEVYDRLWKLNDSKAWIVIDGEQLTERITSEILARITHFTRMRGF